MVLSPETSAKLRQAIDYWWVSPEPDIRGRYTIYRHGKVVEHTTTDNDDAQERMSELRFAEVLEVLREVNQ